LVKAADFCNGHLEADAEVEGEGRIAQAGTTRSCRMIWNDFGGEEHDGGAVINMSGENMVKAFKDKCCHYEPRYTHSGCYTRKDQDAGGNGGEKSSVSFGTLSKAVTGFGGRRLGHHSGGGDPDSDGLSGSGDYDHSEDPCYGHPTAEECGQHDNCEWYTKEDGSDTGTGSEHVHDHDSDGLSGDVGDEGNVQPGDGDYDHDSDGLSGDVVPTSAPGASGDFLKAAAFCNGHFDAGKEVEGAGQLAQQGEKRSCALIWDDMGGEKEATESFKIVGVTLENLFKQKCCSEKEDGSDTDTDSDGLSGDVGDDGYVQPGDDSDYDRDSDYDGYSDTPGTDHRNQSPGF